MSSSVRVVDKGWNAIMDMAREIATSNPHIAVGVIGAPAAQDRGEGMTNADIAVVHEYGTERIPQRSFIGSTIDEKGREYTKQLASGVRAEIASGRASALRNSVAFKRVGLRVVGDIQRRIADGIPPPNSPVTIERKGSSKPLIDSGQLRQSISFEVRS